MPVVVILKTLITAKNGAKWVKFETLSAKTGEPVQIFLSAEQAEKFRIPDSVIVPTAELVEFLGQYTPVQALFNNRGRIESVEA